MISNLRISVAELVVWALLAAAGLTWISLRALDGAAWLMGWLRDRPRIGWVRDWWYDRRHLSPDREPEFKSGLCAGCWDDSEHCDGAIDTCDCTCTWPEDWAEQSEECEPLGLPPERTWEQMTSHQLPVWWRETAAQIVDAQRWWYELPSGTGFTRAMAARVRELAP